MSKRRLHFGVMLHGGGTNMNSWRHPSVPLNASINLEFYLERAKLSERLGMDFVFIADGLYIHENSFAHFLNRFEPLTILSAIAANTKKIGLVGTVSTSYSDPFTVARQFMSLDHISGGRAGWNVVTSPLEGSGRNYCRPHPQHDKRYEIAAEHLEVVTGLWDSWDDDAFIRDRDSGRFMDSSKMHRLNHRGTWFSQVEGPLNVGRSAQGHPVVVEAGASEAGIALAGRTADLVFANGGTFEECRTYYRRIKDAAKAAGRNPDEIKILPGVGPIVGETDAEAEEKYRRIRDMITVEDGIRYLNHFFEHDFSQYPLDETFPKLDGAGTDGFRSTTGDISRRAHEKGLTLREAALDTAQRRAHIGTSESLVGTPEKVAHELIRWVEGGAADGFMLGFQVTGEGLDDFAKYVHPILVEHGYHDGAYPGSTFRDHLGLPFRQSRYATADDALSAAE